MFNSWSHNLCVLIVTSNKHEAGVTDEGGAYTAQKVSNLLILFGMTTAQNHLFRTTVNETWVILPSMSLSELCKSIEYLVLIYGFFFLYMINGDWASRKEPETFVP